MSCSYRATREGDFLESVVRVKTHSASMILLPTDAFSARSRATQRGWLPHRSSRVVSRASVRRPFTRSSQHRWESLKFRESSLVSPTPSWKPRSPTRDYQKKSSKYSYYSSSASTCLVPGLRSVLSLKGKKLLPDGLSTKKKRVKSKRNPECGSNTEAASYLY